MSEQLPKDGLGGFVSAFFGLGTCGMTGPYGLVLNVESLSNPRRDHSIAFDIIGALLCVPMMTLFFIFTTVVFADSFEDPENGLDAVIRFCYPTYWLLWLGWVIYRSVAVWPQIRRNRKEDLQDRTGTSDEPDPSREPIK